jgi:hypothetical protein
MRDKKYYVMDSESKNIEYELIIDDTEEDKVVLRHANSESVSSECRGEVILTATDSGNGLKLKWAEKPGKEFDYSQLHQLNIMLTFINKIHTNPTSTSIIPEVFVKKLL